MTKKVLQADAYSQKNTIRPYMLNIKIFTVAILLLVCSLFMLSYKASENLTDDVWKQLGLTQQQGSDKIKDAFLYGYIENSAAKNLRNLASGNRAAIAKDLIIYSKTYLNGTAFRAAYAKERAASKPENVTFVPVTKEGIKKERIGELRKSIKEMEEAVKKMPALETNARKTIAKYENAIKDYESPDSKSLNVFYETAVNQQKNEQQKHEKRMKDWEMDFPENHTQKVKKYLENYLTLGATVDFDAELAEKNGRKIFVNKEYESKNADWKRIYRGGREVYNATRPLAEQWLKELK